MSGRSTQLFDVRAEPVAVSFTSVPDGVARASSNGGRFVLVGSDGTITLLDARSGTTVATWSKVGIADAVATGNTIVAVDREATVHVRCLAGGKVSEVAKASVGSVGIFVQVVGDHVVVEADGPDPIRVVALASPMPAIAGTRSSSPQRHCHRTVTRSVEDKHGTLRRHRLIV